MNWNNTKTAVVAGVSLLLAAVTGVVIFYSRVTPVRGIPKGWSAISGDADQWEWINGDIRAHSSKGETILASTREYHNVTLSVWAGTTNREASLAFRMRNADNGYIVIFGPAGTPCPWNENGFIGLIRKTSGQEVTLRSYSGRIFSTIGQSAKIAVTAKGPWIAVRLNDVTIFRVADTNYSSGFIGLRIFGTEEYPCDATFSRLIFH
ncbi:MAG TPA: hypothetical protein VMB80_01755 [Candidatus Acidoferrum sp.]|nr:hypothetical protein [Candidatus Acidoferrum sp.]